MQFGRAVRAPDIVNVDPYCRTAVSGADRNLAAQADNFNTSTVFEAWDMLAGLRMPELGGVAVTWAS